MRESYSLNDFHERLVGEAFPGPLDDLDALLLFAVLHTQKINLAANVLADAPHVLDIPAITQRHAALCVASLWRGRADERARPEHWYWAWNTDWSYYRVAGLSGAEQQRFLALKEVLERHPAVRSLEPDEE